MELRLPLLLLCEIRTPCVMGQSGLLWPGLLLENPKGGGGGAKIGFQKKKKLGGGGDAFSNFKKVKKEGLGSRLLLAAPNSNLTSELRTKWAGPVLNQQDWAKMGGATLKVGGAKKIARAIMHGKGVVREGSEHSCQ